MTDTGFGPLLSELRAARLLNQAALARAAGVCEATVSYWESGPRTPQRALLARVVAALDEAAPLLSEETAALWWAAGYAPPDVDVRIMRALIRASAQAGQHHADRRPHDGTGRQPPAEAGPGHEPGEERVGDDAEDQAHGEQTTGHD